MVLFTFSAVENSSVFSIRLPSFALIKITFNFKISPQKVDDPLKIVGHHTYLTTIMRQFFRNYNDIKSLAPTIPS